jgi:peptide/nickel transport system ATP-binding protein
MPYAWGLLASMPRLDQVRKARLDPIPGNPPSLINLPEGCVFAPRCTFQEHVSGVQCAEDRPDLLEVSPGHRVRCHIDRAERERLWTEEIKPRLGS